MNAKDNQRPAPAGREHADEELARVAATTRWAPCVWYPDGRRNLPQLFGFHDQNAAHAAARAASDADPKAIGFGVTRKEECPYDAGAARQMLDLIASFANSMSRHPAPQSLKRDPS